jgi:tetratricopeptide (TPR) repeat protein
MNVYALARWREMIELIDRIQPALEQYGKAADRAWFYGGRTVMAMRRDRYVISDAILADVRSGLDASQRSGDLPLIAQAHFILGWVLVLRGELHEAEEPLLAALTASTQIEYSLYQAWALTWLTVLYRRRGQVEETRRYARRGLEAASAGGIPEQEAMAQAGLAWVAWRRRELAEVERLGQAALDSWQRGQWVYAFHWTARLPLLAVALEREDVPEALDQARALLDPQQQQLPRSLEASLEEAIQADDEGHPEAARAHLERAIELAQELAFL